MAFSSIYKTLFEVRVIHSYYLEDPVAYWSLTSLEERNRELERLGYNISRDLQFLPAGGSTQVLRDQRMRFFPSAYGFKVAVETQEKKVGMNKRYLPVIPIDESFRLYFRIRIRNPYFNNISNVRLTPNIRGNHLFSNLTDALSYPSLHPAISGHNQERAYEMGELSVDGADLYQAFQHTEVAPPAANIWEPVTDFHYLNSSGRYLVPAQFHYLPRPVSAHQPVTFLKAVLEDPIGTQVATTEISNPDGLRQINLNFDDVTPGDYTLKISNSSTQLDQYTITISSDAYHLSDWAMIEIGHRNSLGDFRLLETPDGYLKFNGSNLDTPVFEVRIGSRLTNWEYIPFEDQILTPHSDNSSSITTVGSRLFTKSPRGLSHFPQPIAFKEDGTNDQIYLPNPGKPYVQASDPEQYISIIQLPELNI